MRVVIEGLDGAKSEAARDIFARALANAASTLGLSTESMLATIDFSLTASNKRSPSGAIDKRSNGRVSRESEEIDLVPLLVKPRTNADRLRLDGPAMDAINAALSRLEVRPLVYQTWGLEKIDPFPRLALNFVGPPGTGKTLAAHYIAAKLDKKIVEASYADIVSKYFGEAAKNLSRLYEFARDNDALLFVDEAETLLSRRGSNSGGGVDHAVNSMRSQLLMLIDRTPILSIFASNLVSSYDPAFLSRLITVRFPMPDLGARAEIWASHLPDEFPVDVDAQSLAGRYEGVNGRQIGRIVVEAAHRAAARRATSVSLGDFDWAANFVRGTGEEE
jgi:SpoVK/Ycf46/Vps4 family AAA+-type ATPase